VKYVENGKSYELDPMNMTLDLIDSSSLDFCQKSLAFLFILCLIVPISS